MVRIICIIAHQRERKELFANLDCEIASFERMQFSQSMMHNKCICCDVFFNLSRFFSDGREKFGERKRRQKERAGRGTRDRGSRDGGCSCASEAEAVSISRSWAPDTVFHVSISLNARIMRKMLVYFATSRLARLTVEGQGLLKRILNYFMRGCRELQKIINTTECNTHEKRTLK